MKLEFSSAFLLVSLAFVGCARKEVLRTSELKITQAVALPYAFTSGGLSVNVTGAELNKVASAWNSTLTGKLEANEKWLLVSTTVYEKEGKDKEMDWRLFMQVINASGVKLGPVHLLRSRMISYQPLQYQLSINEREDTKICFRLKEGDFPIKLSFADGRETGPIGWQ